MARCIGLVGLFVALRVGVCQDTPIRDLKLLVGKQVIAQRGILCQPGTFTYSLAYAGKPATVVSLKPSNIRKLSPAMLNRLPPASREIFEDQYRAATILVQFEDGTRLDTCASVAPSKLPEYFELAPGQTIEVAPDVTTHPSTSSPSPLSPQQCPVIVVSATSSSGGVRHFLADALTKSQFDQAVERARHGGNEPHYLDVRVRSSSQKTIRGIEAHVVYANVMGDEGSETSILFQNDKPVKIGGEVRGYSVDTSARWANGKGEVTVYVNRIRFEDNTFWRDDGSRSCALTSDIK